MQRVKLVDVAKAAGVHPGTASRALNPATQDKVSPETLRRVTKDGLCGWCREGVPMDETSPNWKGAA